MTGRPNIIPADSYFEAWLSDGTCLTEKETPWSSISDQKRVGYFEGTKTVLTCRMRIVRIAAKHSGLSAHIDVPDDCEAYQAIRSECFVAHGDRKDSIVGRTIGIVKDGEVVEEIFLNGVAHTVHGVRK